MSPRKLTWGEELSVRVRKYPGGMKAVAERLNEALGEAADGRRSTLAKLQGAESVESLKRVDQWRAWQVLTVLGEDPAEWGLKEPPVPPLVVSMLRVALGTPDPSGPQAAKKQLPRLDSNQQPAGSRPPSRHPRRRSGQVLILPMSRAA